MSADNWAVCPRCVEEVKAEIERTTKVVAATYGHVPVEDFDAARASIPAFDKEKHRTFRENYDIDAETGTVEIGYSGYCTVCKLSVTASFSRQFWPEP